MLIRPAILTVGLAVMGHSAAAQTRWIWPFDRGELTVINVIPNAQSGETNQDSEPFLALNRNNTTELVATAFTPGGGVCAANTAPVFVSVNTGTTWAVACVVPSDAASSGTGDITVAYPTIGNVLYSGILRRPSAGLRLNILSVVSPGQAGALMNPLVDRLQPDQPFVQAITSAGQDRVYVGHNDFAAGTQTATVELSQAGSAMVPAFNVARLERRATVGGQNGPPIRPAPHRDSTVYAAYLGRWQRNGAIRQVDVVVVRDDALGTGAAPFSALLDPGDGLAGNRVIQNTALRWNAAGGFGQERLGGYLSLTVHPDNSSEVWLAWVDTGTANVPTIHVRHSTDRGVTWDANDLRTVASAINPALALTTGGEVGFLYQNLATVGGVQRWITIFERTSDDFVTRRTDTLATVVAAQPAGIGLPYLGDYVHLTTHGRTFYGVFSAANVPINANFPSGVVYQRNANFATNQLTDAAGNVVAQSIDPFYFRARTPTFRRLCDLLRLGCITIGQGLTLEPERIRWRCDQPGPCIVVDPIPRNCTMKWGGACPGCEGALCPGLWEFTFEGLGPEWQIVILDPEGEVYGHRQVRRGNVVTVSFVPRREDFRGTEMGDYRLVFAADSGAVRRGAEMNIVARRPVIRPVIQRGGRPPL